MKKAIEMITLEQFKSQYPACPYCASGNFTHKSINTNNGKYILVDSRFSKEIRSSLILTDVISTYELMGESPFKALIYWALDDFSDQYNSKLAQLNAIYNYEKRLECHPNLDKYYRCLVNYYYKMKFIGKYK